MANTTPAVNLDPNFTKNSTYPKIAQRAFVFDINDAQNGVFLPTSDTAAQADFLCLNRTYQTRARPSRHMFRSGAGRQAGRTTWPS